MGHLICYSNFLKNSLIEKIHNCVEETKVWETNYSFWDPRLVNSSAPILVFDLTKTLESTIIEQVKAQCKEIRQYQEIKLRYYKMMPGAYIPWHNDGGWSFAMTIYLNKNWDKDFGGYFAFAHDNQIKCLPPAYNSSVFISAPLEHCVFQTVQNAPPRTTVQIFGR
jgi:Rps23 Pro-64 3,4-dihydroxylase Tpa1-like proline 4-hydroxylase